MKAWLFIGVIMLFTHLSFAQECETLAETELPGISDELTDGFPEALNTAQKRESLIKQILSNFLSYYDNEAAKQNQDAFKEAAAAAASEHEFYNIIREWVNALYEKDGSSSFSSNRELNFQDDSFQAYAGVGINVDGDGVQPYLTILGVRPDGPAHAAGIKSRDRILAIDEEGCPEIAKVRGEAGRDVTLTLQSPGAEPKDVTLTRTQFNTGFNYRLAFRLETHPHVGYFFLGENSFEEGSSSADVLTELAERGVKSHQKTLEGLILDLRYGSGGSVDAFNTFLGHFIASGVRPYALRSPFSDNPAYIGRQEPDLTALPLAVLVDDSSLDIMVWLAGVLKERPNTVLVGQPTGFNPYSYQVEILQDGSEFFFPVNTFIVSTGDEFVELENGTVTPDVLVEGDGFAFAFEDDPFIKVALEELAKLQEE